MDTAIKVEGLVKEYKFGAAVNNVSFELKQGRIYGLVGPNGAGKSTIMKMLGGLSVPTDGSIHFYSKDEEITPEKARENMSFMIEQPYLRLSRNARFNLNKQRILRGIENKEIVDEVLKSVGLSEVPKSKKVKEYSLGMKQRLGIAGCLMNEPFCMVLDEPVNGLDPEGIVEIRKLLLDYNEKHNTTILISSHILGELSQLCTDYLFIKDGRIIKEITWEELKNSCTGDVYVHTDDDEKAMVILEEKYTENSIEVIDGRVVITGGIDIISDISKTLCSKGLTILHLSNQEQDLEKYYLSLINEKEGE